MLFQIFLLYHIKTKGQTNWNICQTNLNKYKYNYYFKCYYDNDKKFNFYVKKDEILQLSLILSINTNISNFNLLKKNNDFINNRIMYDEIIIYEKKNKFYE